MRFLQAVRTDGSASFVGIERITGSIGGRTGSFLLQDAPRRGGSVNHLDGQEEKRRRSPLGQPRPRWYVS